MAVLLVIGPIFDGDLFPWQYGFREGMDAKMALRRIHYGIADRGAREVVDADLADYFNMIPHGRLLRCVARRIADGTVLAIIRQWLDTPVVERDHTGGKLARRWQGTPIAAHRKETLSPRCWRTYTSVVSCWRGTSVDMRGGYKLK